MIDHLRLSREEPVIDVGAGASRLAAELLERGFENITAADLSAKALKIAQTDLGNESERIDWIVADLCSHDFGRRFALWHDRAVFHFMVAEADRRAYLETAARSIKPGGDLIIATFGPQGPTTCSGLPVTRYGAADLAQALGADLELEAARIVDHGTPSGKTQQFMYAHVRRR
jgi:ubiquinone/menaquinone biosynthesis C-methylase UbiE